MSGFLDANLRALSGVDAALASRIASCRPSPGVSYAAASSGAPVPRVRDSDSGRFRALHSAVDPGREGRRIYGELQGAGFMVFIGMGAAYHIVPALEDASISGILVIEEDLSFARSILENIELTRLLGDSRVRLLVAPAPGAAEAALVSSYVPALMGSMKSFTLRTMRHGAEFGGSVAGEIGSAMERIRADFSAQARFGKRWVSNTLTNLPYIGGEGFVPAGKREVWIAAAGPSLDLQIPLLRDRDPDAMLLSTDTALPALLARGLRPDAVISIDCQHYGYHHLLASRIGGCSPESVPFLFDVSSPPVLVRAAERRGFFAGGHPLSRYIARNWIQLPQVDTSGGNVAYAALSAAQTFGARRIGICGLDYSYPDGKPYARGTYIPTLFDSGSLRLEPAESRYASLVWSGDVMRSPIENGWRYTKPLLDSYHAGMRMLISRAEAEVTVPEGRGLPFPNLPVSGKNPRLRSWDPLPRPRTGWREFLGEYRTSVSSLTIPGNPPGLSIRMLPDDEREVWMTLLPLLPGLEAEGNACARSHLLEKAKEWTLSRLDRTLNT